LCLVPPLIHKRGLGGDIKNLIYFLSSILPFFRPIENPAPFGSGIVYS
jgi:hypothetical protein